MAILELKNTVIGKGYILYDWNYRRSCKRQNCENNGGWNGIEDKQAEHRAFLNQWKYSIWYYNDEYISLDIFQTQNVQQ